MGITVSVIGFGNIGKFISGLLLTHRDHSIQLNIIDTDWNVHGAILDMEQGIELFPDHSISYNDEDLLNASDFIFHCAGASVPRGKSRLVTCQNSIEITETIFKNFRPKRAPFVIVVANPVEIITFITLRVTGLPKERVMGTGTFLDSIRMNHVIKKTNPDVSSADAILLGEHGTSVFLSEQLSTVNGQAFGHLYDQDSIEELMNQVKASAEEIKETQDATIYGVSYCAVQLFKALLSEHKLMVPVSTFVPDHLRPDLQNTPISLSLYSEVNHTGVHPIQQYHPDKRELQFLNKSIDLMTPFIPQRFL